MSLRLALVFLAAAGTAVAQTDSEPSPFDGVSPFDASPPFGGPSTLPQMPDVKADEVHAKEGTGAEIRGLDKISGDVTDLKVKVGGTVEVGRLVVTLEDCRYPEDNATGEAYAWMDIRDGTLGTTYFSGWMVASSPALNALDHPRYDVWVIRCTTA